MRQEVYVDPAGAVEDAREYAECASVLCGGRASRLAAFAVSVVGIAPPARALVAVHVFGERARRQRAARAAGGDARRSARAVRAAEA